MPLLVNSDDARELLRFFGGWFGTPVVLYPLDEPIDGRKRLQAARSLGLSVPPPLRICSRLAAVRWLVCAQHYDRAAELIDGLLPIDRHLPQILGLSRQQVVPLLARHGNPQIQRRVKDPNRGARQRAMGVIRRLRELRALVDEELHEVTVHDIDRVLGHWAP